MGWQWYTNSTYRSRVPEHTGHGGFSIRFFIIQIPAFFEYDKGRGLWWRVVYMDQPRDSVVVEGDHLWAAIIVFRFTRDRDNKFHN
jgi:hypothetical protein